MQSRRAQLLPAEKILLIVADRTGNLSVYLESLTAIDNAISKQRGKSLNREKIGQDFVLAFDESKRMLSVVSSDKVRISIMDRRMLLVTIYSCYFISLCMMTPGASKHREALST